MFLRKQADIIVFFNVFCLKTLYQAFYLVWCFNLPDNVEIKFLYKDVTFSEIVQLFYFYWKT